MTFTYDFPYKSQRMPVLAQNVVATSQPLAAQAGLEILRDVYIQHAPLAVEDSAVDQGDLASIRFRRVLGGRVPDGTQLYAELDTALRPEGGGSGGLPADPVIDPVHHPALEAVARRWLDWWDEWNNSPEPHKIEDPLAVEMTREYLEKKYGQLAQLP